MRTGKSDVLTTGTFFKVFHKTISSSFSFGFRWESII